MPYANFKAVALTVAVAAFTGFAGSASAAPLDIADAPLFLQESVPPLNMLVLGRDHKLYYEAYNDYSDLNGDGTLDLKYKPTQIDYYGYFNSYRCYTHDGSKFVPASATGTNKTCSGATEWSGDWLNYMTTSRIDALRKVLYGGYRSTDTTTETVLERSFIPQDAHSWGKEYRSVAVDGYDIQAYTPLSLPSGSGTRRHLFANTTPLNTTTPLLRYLTSRTERIWNWVSIERPVAGTQILDASGARQNVTPTDLAVRVQVCVAGKLESNCQAYGANYKPIGLLQEFGENDSMYFGLITGSYSKNTNGGVLRRPVSSIRDEIDPATGVFLNGVKNGASVTSNAGILTTLNRLRATGFGNSHQYSCAWNVVTRPIQDGECQMWGNPIGEMMYESLRYFAGKATPTSDFSISYGAGEESSLTGGGLPVSEWDDPYETRPVCSKPFQTVVSDINPSYDTDKVPGSAFASFTGDLDGLNAADLGQQIWNREFAGSQSVFIGQSGGTSDGAPSPKTVSSFGNIRGLSPEEPTKMGGYYSASVAFHGATNDMHDDAAGDQKVATFAVALASPLPKISIPVGTSTVTLVPFAKSVAGSGISSTSTFQPTNQIVDFYVDSLTSTSGTFRVNFEDVEQGADHDMDAIAVYQYSVANGQVTITLTSEYAYGGITQHMGYVISGTTKDGIYLELMDRRDGDSGTDTDYRLDTPPTFTGTPPAPSSGAGQWNDGRPLPGANLNYGGSGATGYVATRTFSPGTTAGASILKDPLWYAAKYGGFQDSNDNAVPDVAVEWDENNNGTPDNYFLVTNALTLSAQLRSAFDEIIERNGSASSASVNSGSVSSDTRIYQAKFNSGSWTGQLLSYPVNANGSLGSAEWDAANMVPAHGSRAIITVNSDGTPIPFRWNSLDNTRKAQIEPTYATDATLATRRFDYLRGDASQEQKNGGAFRDRPTRLGDIVSSSPLFVGPPFFAYNDSLEEEPYSEFRSEHAERTAVVYAGANDGMLHAFNAETGVEMLAFVPSAAYRNLASLSSTTYSHKFFVDGPPNMRDVYFDDEWHTVLVGGLNKGGQEIYALNITDPSTFSEANAASLVLWEFTDRDADGATNGFTGDADLGYTYSQPAIVRLRDGRWAAIFGNGYNNTEADGSASSTGNAVLYVVDVEDGTLIRKIDTTIGSADDPSGQSRPNGLGTPAAVDLNGDRNVDYVYAGDLFGNMWKFDLTDSSPSDWSVSFGTDSEPLPLFTATWDDPDVESDTPTLQAITSRPEVIRGPNGVGMMVLFGTGKYLESADKLVDEENPEIQSYYGIWDRNSPTADDDGRVERDELLRQEIVAEQTLTLSNGTFRVRATTNHELVAQKGWYMDLLSPAGYDGERQVSNTTVRGGRVIFTTLIPDSNPCNYGGSSWLMELDALDGSRLGQVPFDLNNDGKFDGTEMATIGSGDSTQAVPISGLQSAVGITPEPGILFSDGATKEFLYNPGTTGNISMTIGSTDPRAYGRQSWRHIK